MKYYSEMLEKLFDTPGELRSAEEEHTKKIEAEKAEKEAKNAKRKEMAAKVEEARKKMTEAQHEYSAVMKEFLNAYGSYHYSTKNVDDIPYLFDLKSFFNL